MSESKKTGKPILVDFYTDWCGWCKHLDETTYKDNRVKLLGDEFLWVRLDAERAGKDLAAKYEVNAYPMLVFVDATGKELSRVRGYHDGDAFTKDLTGVLNAARASELTKAVAAAPNDAATLSRLSVFYSGQGQLDDAKTYLDRAAAQDPNRQSEAVLAAYRALSAAYYQNKDWAAAIPIFEEQIRRGHEIRETILSQLMLGISYLKNNEKSKAIAVSQSIKNNAQATQEEKQVADRLIAAAK